MLIVREADGGKPSMREDLSQFYWRLFSNSFKTVDKIIESDKDEFSVRQQLYRSKYTVVEKKPNQLIKVWYMTYNRHDKRLYEHSIFLFADEYKVLRAAAKKIDAYSDSFLADPNGAEQREKPRQTKMWAFRWVTKAGVLQAPEKWYYSKEDAIAAAQGLKKFETDAAEEDITLQVEHMYRFQGDYTSLTEVVFIYLLRKLISMIMVRRCPGCKGKAPAGHTDHEGDEGCQRDWYSTVDHYYSEAMDYINHYLPAQLLENMVEKMRIPRIWPIFHVKCFKGYGGYDKVFQEVRRPMDANDKYEGKYMLMERVALQYGLDNHLKKYFFHEQVDIDEEEEEED